MSVGSSAGWIFGLGPQHLYPFFQPLHPFISEPRDRNMDQLVPTILHGMDLHSSSFPLRIFFGSFSQLSCKFSCPFRALFWKVLQDKLLSPGEGSPGLCCSSPSPVCPLSSACVPEWLVTALEIACCHLLGHITQHFPASLLLCPAQLGDTANAEPSRFSR